MSAVCGLAARIGRKTYPMQSLEQASAAYRRTIEHLGLGASQTPRCEIVNLLGDVIATVAYNGCVFSRNGKVLYDPR